MHKFWFAGAAALISMPVLAHDFWIQPNRFVLDAPGPVAVTMYVGHGQAKDRWGVSADHILQFNAIGPKGLTSRLASLRMNGRAFDALVPLEQPGCHILALQSKSALSQLPAVRFNDYVKTEGITPIASARARAGSENSEGREFYSRRAKTIVQVGPVDAASIARATSPVRLKLEIVPGRHPQKLGAGNTMPVQVLFNGKPLAGALVKLTDLDADAEPVGTERTNSAGRATLRIPHAGKWQMNVVWAEPLRSASADYRTTFSSLAFQTL